MFKQTKEISTSKFLLIEMVIYTYKNWRNDRTLRLGAGIAYYGVFAIVPIAILMVGLATSFFSSVEVQEFLEGAFSTMFGEESGVNYDAIAEKIRIAHQTSQNSSFGVIGVLSLVFSASLIFVAFQDALDTIWHNPIRLGWKKWIKRYLWAYVVVLLASTLLFATLLVNSIGTLAKYFIPGEMEALDGIADLLTSVGSWVVGILILALIFKLLIYQKVKWVILLIGSAITSLLIVVGTWLLSHYITTYASTSLTGAIGGIFLVLIWIYYEAQIFLIGAQIIKTLSYYQQKKKLPFIS